MFRCVPLFHCSASISLFLGVPFIIGVPLFFGVPFSVVPCPRVPGLSFLKNDYNNATIKNQGIRCKNVNIFKTDVNLLISPREKMHVQSQY